MRRLLPLGLVLALALSAPAAAQVRVGDLSFEGAGVRERSIDHPYVVVTNHSSEPDRLLGARCECGRKVWLVRRHLKPLGDTYSDFLFDERIPFIVIPGNSRRAISPYQGEFEDPSTLGYAMELEGSQVLEDGQEIVLVLTFERTGDVRLAFPVSMAVPPYAS